MHTPLPAPTARYDVLRHAIRIGKLILVGLSLVAAGEMRAQNQKDGSNEVARVAPDLDWDSLQKKTMAGGSSQELPADEATRQKVRDEQVTDFLDAAVSAKKFQTDYPSDIRRQKARVIEVRNLLKAALLGDQSKRAQAFLQADELKADLTIDEGVRFDVAFLQQEVLVRGFISNMDDYFAACEVSARGLIKDYPAQPGGYEWLLTSIGGMADDAKLAAAAKEVIGSGAPFQAKSRATIIAERFDLVGRSLADFANTALGRDNYFEQSRKRRTVLYTWNARDPGSVAWAADLERQLPSDVLGIGVCLSTDVEMTKGMAKRMKLSSWQYFSEGGPGSFLALRLKLNAPGQIYVTDSAGVIVTVTAREDNVLSFLGK
jgi:hypothetical protein